MDEETRDMFKERALIMKALAHPTRLFIVDRLGRRETCVCELVSMIGADMSTVSKHLSILKSAGIVEDEKRGLRVFYRLRWPCVLRFFDCIEGVLSAAAKERLKRYAK
ncbi:MAG: metalloregulator ArsR/SmtB family transcription factor [Planctomycetota bacterium]|nr:metalloregulator ArsR/SmtB family transcription factor [Planctomycetota bacterium]